MMAYGCGDCQEIYVPVRRGLWAPQGSTTDPDCRHPKLIAVGVRR